MLPRSALIAGVLGALTLFAIVAGAFVVTSDADSAEACRRIRSCGFEEREDDNNCDRLMSVSSRSECEEPPICQTEINECCDISVDSIGNECCEININSEIDPCEPPSCIENTLECCEALPGSVETSECPPPVCDSNEQSQCCVREVGVSEINECCDTSAPASTDSVNECCDVIGVTSVNECEPPCTEELSISSRGCDCEFPTGVNASESDCGPREDRCEQRSFRRLGRWGSSECEQLPL